MGRLIDENELIKGRVENDPVVIATKCAPTAFDPDRVVEQLEAYSNEEEAERLGTIPVVELADAIEIVKGGGINDNSN